MNLLSLLRKKDLRPSNLKEKKGKLSVLYLQMLLEVLAIENKNQAKISSAFQEKI